LKKNRFLFLLIFIAIQVFAQNNNFVHYGLNEGISQGAIRVILKDTDGFVWLGTQDGLNRFDGNSFKIYRHNNQDPHSISGNYINALLDDTDKIWIATANDGLCYYDKKLDDFKHVGAKNANCTALAKDAKGNIYAVYNNGLVVYTLKEKKIIKNKNRFENLKNIRLTSIFINDKQALFMGSEEGNLYYADLLDKTNILQVSYPSIPIKTINSISRYKDNELWLGSNSGLYHYDRLNKSFQKVCIDSSYHNNTENFVIYDIVQVADFYYIASDNGLFFTRIFDEKIGKFKYVENFKGDKNNINSITSNRVYDLLIDKNTLWIGTNKLDILSLNESVFKTINTTSKIRINNDFVFSIFKTNNYTFIGTRNGLNCIDNKGNLSIISKENTNNKLTYNVIRGINKDSNNNLWLATTKGVSVISLDDFDPNNPKIKSIYFDDSNPKSLSHNNTRSIFIDHSNQIWVATFGGGINKFIGNLKTNDFSFTRYTSLQNKNPISSDFTYNISQDSNDNYWISTKKGLNKLSFKANNTAVFSLFDKVNKKINTNAILTTYQDKKRDIIWVGSHTGLYKINKKTKEIKSYTKKDGLTSSVVYSILEDTDEKLWLSTNLGLFSFDKDTEIFTNFSVKDGLQSSEFNLGALYNDHNTLYFGGVNGVNYFKPKDINKLYSEGNLIFTSLRVKDSEISPSKHADILKNNIINAKKITLNHDQFPAYLSFSDLNYSQARSSEFVYKLLPNDTEWNKLNERKEIQLLNLAAGNYKIQVQGKSNHIFWKKTPLEITLFVKAAWYKSRLAYLFYTLLFLATIILLYRFQFERKLNQREVTRLKELNDLKTKLYANITHEFRTPITVILGMAQNLKENVSNRDKKSKTALEMIERNANSLLNLVNQILDLAKLEKGKLKLNLAQGNIINHLKYITESYTSFAKDKKIDLVFYNEIDEIIMDYDAEKISLVLKNLISNAIKFCRENDKIIVHVKQDEKTSKLIIIVKDTGIGISKKDLAFIFDRFYQADKKDQQNIGGTGIGLALTKELLKMMNASIQVTSTLTKGTTFSINIPINKAHSTQQSTAYKKTKSIALQIEKEPNTISQDDKALPIALVVEDNKDVATYILSCLEGTYQTLFAENGKIGISLALTHTPDIIISDIMMPEINGFEVCEILKKDEKTNHIPIILLTAKTSQESKIEGLSYGADAYLTKPFHKKELLIRAKKMIELRNILQEKYKNATSWKVQAENTLPNKNDVFINKIITKITENIDDNAFNSTELAKSLFLSESQLYRKLKALTNTSTAIFIRKVRLQKAKQLIESTDKTIAEICYETGFNDPSWFSKAFKQEFGFSPSIKR